MVPDRYHIFGHCFPVAAGNPNDRFEHDVLRKLIAEWRTQAGLSQRELSARLGRPHNYMAKIESGTRGVAVVEMIDIARALNKTVNSALAEFALKLG